MASNRFKLILEETEEEVTDEFDRMTGDEAEEEMAVDEVEDEKMEAEEDTLFDLMADFILGLDPDSIDADSMTAYEEIKSQLEEMESEESGSEEDEYSEYDMKDGETLEEPMEEEEEVEESVSGKKSRFTFC